MIYIYIYTFYRSNENRYHSLISCDIQASILSAHSGDLLACIQTEYGEMQNISSYSVRTQENTDQKNFEYEHFSGSGD